MTGLPLKSVPEKVGTATSLSFMIKPPNTGDRMEGMADEAAREEANGDEDRDGNGESTDEDKKDRDAEGSDADL